MKISFYTLGLVAMAALITSCGGNANKKSADADDTKSAEDEGWVTIFDGKSFDGWRGYNRTDVPARWVIEDGMMKFNGSGTGEGQANDGGDLIYDTKFNNFELEFEWKISKGGNSGAFFLAKEVPDQPIYISSPEYQLLDNENHLDAKLGVDGNRMSASLYDMIPAKPQNANPAEQWNKAKIMVYQGTVVHYQNDVPVVEYHLWTPEWTALIEKSKFSSTNPNWPMSFDLLNNLGKDEQGNFVGGFIGFQDHGNDVWFRNIRVKDLNVE